jgi:hypothetical protein
VLRKNHDIQNQPYRLQPDTTSKVLLCLLLLLSRKGFVIIQNIDKQMIEASPKQERLFTL